MSRGGRTGDPGRGRGSPSGRDRRSQRGETGRQIRAPSSMRAWLISPGTPSSSSLRAASSITLRFAGDFGSPPSARSRLRTRRLFPSSAGSRHAERDAGQSARRVARPRREASGGGRGRPGSSPGIDPPPPSRRRGGTSHGGSSPARTRRRGPPRPGPRRGPAGWGISAGSGGSRERPSPPGSAGASPPRPRSGRDRAFPSRGAGARGESTRPPDGARGRRGETAEERRAAARAPVSLGGPPRPSSRLPGPEAAGRGRRGNCYNPRHENHRDRRGRLHRESSGRPFHRPRPPRVR